MDLRSAWALKAGFMACHAVLSWATPCQGLSSLPVQDRPNDGVPRTSARIPADWLRRRPRRSLFAADGATKRRAIAVRGNTLVAGLAPRGVRPVPPISTNSPPPLRPNLGCRHVFMCCVPTWSSDAQSLATLLTHVATRWLAPATTATFASRRPSNGVCHWSRPLPGTRESDGCEVSRGGFLASATIMYIGVKGPPNGGHVVLGLVAHHSVRVGVRSRDLERLLWRHHRLAGLLPPSSHFRPLALVQTQVQTRISSCCLSELGHHDIECPAGRRRRRFCSSQTSPVKACAGLRRPGPQHLPILLGGDQCGAQVFRLRARQDLDPSPSQAGQACKFQAHVASRTRKEGPAVQPKAKRWPAWGSKAVFTDNMDTPSALARHHPTAMNNCRAFALTTRRSFARPAGVGDPHELRPTYSRTYKRRETHD